MRAQEIVLKTNLDSLAAGAGVGGGGNVVAAVGWAEGGSVVCSLFVHIGGSPFQLIGGNETNVLKLAMST